MAGKYYWLKLKRDFFKRHDIRIIEEMPNGTDYILFYLKLLCESVDHDGNLRFSDTIPYSEQMLSVITNTNEDIVHRAVEIFTGLEMMELLDDGTYFMNEVQGMVGSCANNDNANAVRRHRERKKMELQAQTKPTLPPKKPNEDFEKFWKAYPKKKSKATAEKAFEKAIKKTDVDTMIKAVEAQKQTRQWKESGGQYIPYPSTWLNAESWQDEDEPKPVSLRRETTSKRAGLGALAKQLGVDSDYLDTVRSAELERVHQA